MTHLFKLTITCAFQYLTRTRLKYCLSSVCGQTSMHTSDGFSPLPSHSFHLHNWYWFVTSITSSSLLIPPPGRNIRANARHDFIDVIVVQTSYYFSLNNQLYAASIRTLKESHTFCHMVIRIFLCSCKICKHYIMFANRVTFTIELTMDILQHSFTASTGLHISTICSVISTKHSKNSSIYICSFQQVTDSQETVLPPIWLQSSSGPIQRGSPHLSSILSNPIPHQHLIQV